METETELTLSINKTPPKDREKMPWHLHHPLHPSIMHHALCITHHHPHSCIMHYALPIIIHINASCITHHHPHSYIMHHASPIIIHLHASCITHHPSPYIPQSFSHPSCIIIPHIYHHASYVHPHPPMICPHIHIMHHVGIMF